MSQARERLPDRRYSETLTFVHDGQKYHGSVSWFVDSDRVAEIFLIASKPGSVMEAIARDSAVSASLALQYGVPAQALQTAVTRDDNGNAAGPLGQLLDLIAEARP